MDSIKSKVNLARNIQFEMAKINETSLHTFINYLKHFKSTNDFIDDTNALNAIVKNFNRHEIEFLFKISELICCHLLDHDTRCNELIHNSNGEALFSYYKILIDLDYHIQPTYMGSDDNLRDKLYLMKYTVNNMKKN